MRLAESASRQLTISNQDSISQSKRWQLIVILGGLMAMQPFALDPFLAAAPAISKTFMVGDSVMQLTLSGLTLGFAVGQLIAGPLSDTLGRRKPILIAAIVYVMAAAVVVFAPNIVVFALGRIVQGVAAASIQVVGNAIMRDLYAGSALMKLMSRVFLIQALSWFIGPSAGALLQQSITWRGMAVVIGIYGITMLLLAKWHLPETLAHGDRSDRVGILVMAKRFGSVLHDRAYVGIVIVAMLNNIALFGYLSVIPFIYQHLFGMTAAGYGFMLMFNSALAYIGVQAIAALARRFPTKWVVVGFLAAQVLAGLLLIVLAQGEPNLVQIEVTLAVFCFFIGGSFAPLGALALTRHGEEAGTAAALNMVLGSVGAVAAAPLFAVLGTQNTGGLGGLIVGAYVLALIVMFAVVRVRKLTSF